uniref:PB1 domain-containing protein n=1 Tax=Micrurus corallinus TaxID=54390 RepID=A0A2D4FAW5_MICCO
MDEEEVLNSIMKDLAALGKCGGFLDSNRNKNHSNKQLRNARIKFEHDGEKRIIQFQRPVKYKDVLQKVMDAFGQLMDLHYAENEVPCMLLLFLSLLFSCSSMWHLSVTISQTSIF